MKNISVILLGGEMSHRGHCHDYYTVQMVRNIRIDKAFLSHDAFSLEFGAPYTIAPAVEFGRAVMESSSMNIGCNPSAKNREKCGSFRMCSGRLRFADNGYRNSRRFFAAGEGKGNCHRTCRFTLMYSGWKDR